MADWNLLELTDEAPWWNCVGCPAFDTFGLDIDPDGTRTVRCGAPGGPSWPVPRAG
ncbi:hypothetical protein [Embleya sp. NPDC005575]|uniref:hypothetical protein n=1 Tax=Embleya sp. NPDC005575 TaxID=3156892 RepID=UPI0033AA3BE7